MDSIRVALKIALYLPVVGEGAQTKDSDKDSNLKISNKLQFSNRIFPDRRH